MAAPFTIPRRVLEPTPAELLIEEEARRLRISYRAIRNFKRRHQIPGEQPLTPEAEALLLQEVETAARVAKGEAIERSRTLEAIAAVTTEQAAAVAAAIPSRQQLVGAGLFTSGLLESGPYLLDRVELLTGKRYASIGRGLPRCRLLVPAAAQAEPPIGREYGGPCRRDQAIFWGVILRLDHLQGPPPAEPRAFWEWGLLSAYQGHSRELSSLADTLGGRICDEEARRLLALPASGPLAAASIRDAYRSAAAAHHPDRGGDPARFQRLTEARDRLLCLAA